MTDISHIQAFLLCETPDSWIRTALDDIPMLLIDHANCELKAAQTAQSIIWKYGIETNLEAIAKKSSRQEQTVVEVLHYQWSDNYDLMHKMSRLAREELRHFEQVIAIMQKRGIRYTQVEAARYAGQLRKSLRNSEPEKLIDTLIIGAIIEARSCERFARLAPELDDELQQFYRSLLKSEARHYQDYLSLAQKAAGDQSIQARTKALLEIEKTLILEKDEKFRFHSGTPLVKNSS